MAGNYFQHSQQYSFTRTVQYDLSMSRERERVCMRCVWCNSITFQGMKCKKAFFCFPCALKCLQLMCRQTTLQKIRFGCLNIFDKNTMFRLSLRTIGCFVFPSTAKPHSMKKKQNNKTQMEKKMYYSCLGCAWNLFYCSTAFSIQHFPLSISTKALSIIEVQNKASS